MTIVNCRYKERFILYQEKRIIKKLVKTSLSSDKPTNPIILEANNIYI